MLFTTATDYDILEEATAGLDNNDMSQLSATCRKHRGNKKY